MKRFYFFLTFALMGLTSLSAKPAVADANGKMPGKFSVACGEYVYFSQGNLQYTKSTDTWSFMEEQYSIVETNTTTYTTVGDDYANRDVVSLFGWGTSGWDNTSADPTSVHYQPYSTSQTSDYSHYPKNQYLYGPSDDNVVGSSNAALAESWSKQVGENHPYENYDWGVYNSGDLGSGWRTLTIQEWKYLMSSRPNAGSLRTLATVNGMQGMIIMPDGWTEEGVSLTLTMSSHSTNNINLTDWGTLEEQGCVFLPAAGYRYGKDVDCVRSCCKYWSSSSVSGAMAYSLSFCTNNTGDGQTQTNRWHGLSVRLVQDVDPADNPAMPQAYVTSNPVGKTNMTYNGSSQTLLSSLASGATGGTVKYKLSTSESWYTSNIYAFNAGDYIVQWFVDHTGNSQCYQSSDVQEIHVTVKRASTSAPSPMPTIAAATSLTYNGSAQNLVTNTGSIQSGYTTVYSADGVNWSEDIPQETDAGDYTVYYKFYKGANEEYIPSPNTINANIAKANPPASLPASSISIPYDGAAHTLLEVDPVADCVIWYKLGDGDWTTTPPTGTDAGDYSVQYKIVPNDAVNYNTIGPNTVTVTILDYPTVYDNADPTAKLTELLNTPSDLKVKRTIYRNGEYNTICLPFALDATQLAASPLNGFNNLKTIKGASVTGSGQNLSIDIFVEDVTAMEAGKPYLISYPSANDNIVNPVFTGITVTTTEPGDVTADGVTFQGMFAQVHIDPYDAGHTQDYLFLGANSQLMWPNNDGSYMRGFRAYFIIDRQAIPNNVAPKGTRVRLMNAPAVVTGIENTELNTQAQKLLENGQLIILKNGIKYNAQGQVVK